MIKKVLPLYLLQQLLLIMVEPISIFALAGISKWIYDTCARDAETAKLVAKAERLEKAWKTMDHRTTKSREVRIQLEVAKALIKNNKAAEAGGVIDGVLSILGM